MTTDATPASGTSTTAAPVVDTTTAAPVVDTTAQSPAATTATPTPDQTPATGEDWASLRQRYAKGDEKTLKHLERYSSSEAALDALFAAQKKIAEKGTRLPANPTAEQIAAWRTENGVPDDPSKYDTKLKDGLAFGEDDQPMVDAFLKRAHETNMSPAQVKETLSFFAAESEQRAAELQAADKNFRETSTEELRAEWGTEYKYNINQITALLDTAPPGMKELISGARLADGALLGDSPGALRWLANLARTINPTATVVPGAGMTSAQAVDNEIDSIVKLMGDKNSAYWKGLSADKMQSRYRDLVTAQEKFR